ncbi:Hypothetical predicted protein [Mytilus galloprovincialis]|uniref:Uncharacterized protein n=1 Tax=Mytilus galloprovincialis TaxID=29158 RepID=A0A8B6DQ79_MYTGA|nr:Hypothetical predicted protein [Mytilus galloprovincialis]
MLLLLVLSLLLFEGHARSPMRAVYFNDGIPSFPNPEKCEIYLNKAFECRERPSIEKYINTQDANGEKLGTTFLDLVNARKTTIEKAIVADMCSYYVGVSACMKATIYHYIGKYCPARQFQVAKSYQIVTSAVCSKIAEDLEAMVQCANHDNGILVTFASCMYGAYSFIKAHPERHHASMIDRYRDCFYQFESCPKQMMTWDTINVFNEYHNDISFLLSGLGIQI